MNPDQIDAATTALINIGAAVDTCWPGVALTAAAWAVLWTGRRIRTHIARQRQERRDKANAYWTQCFNPPAVDTKAGHNADDLKTCLQILRATNTARKEKP